MEPRPAMETRETRLRVRYAETDQMGVVYYANYLVWMEVGRVEYCRAAGLDYHAMERSDGILLTVAEANCRYLAPAVYDDEVVVRTWIEKASPRLLRFAYEMCRLAGGEVLARGHTTHVFCDRELRRTKLPHKYRPLLGIR